jgi:hypothetical protein
VRSRVIPSPGLVVVVLGVLGAAAATGWLWNSASFSDADDFAAAGRMMLSPGWRHTYANPWLQAGPFELLVCLAGRTLGIRAVAEPIAFNLIGAGALLLVAGSVLRRWQLLLVVCAGAIALRIVSDMYEIGHPAELFIALLWLLAARAARHDRVLLAGVLLGVSAGFETWGLLGAPLLLLLPRLRGTVAAGGIALAVAAAIFAPFALGGDFHMFDLHWEITGGIDGLIFGEGHNFTWPMRLGEAVVVVGAGSALALATRRRPMSMWLVPAATSICRLVLDPVRYGYYWDTSLILLLIGAAPFVASPRAVAERLAAVRRPRHVPALSD